MKAVKSPLVIVTIMIVLSCSNKNQNSDCVFVENNSVVHMDENCSKIDTQAQMVIYTSKEVARGICDSSIKGAICAMCVDKTISEKIEKEKKIYNDEKQRRLESLEEEFEALRAIGKDKWISFDDYLHFICSGTNRTKLELEVCKEGWGGLLDLQSSFMLSRYIMSSEEVLWNDFNIKELYIKTKQSGMGTGTLYDFRRAFKNVDSCVFYYEKSKEFGIVDNWETFLKMLFKPNCYYCDEELWETWSERIEELWDEQKKWD